MQRRVLIRLAATGVAAASVRGAFAQERYPSRPITLIVGFAAGGNGDITIRYLANALKDRFDVPIVVENRPGAGGALAAERTARARPDGYTFSMYTASPFVVEPVMRPAPYDPAKDFTYVAQYLITPQAAFVLSSSRFRTWQDVIDFARANPDRFRWATAAARGGPYIATEAAFRKEGLTTIVASYNGGAPAVAALLAGDIDMVVSPDYPPLLDAGQVRLLAEIGPERVRGLENVPTFGELGYPLTLQVNLGVVGPAGLPPEVVRMWEEGVREVTATAEWEALMVRLRAVTSYLPSAPFTRRVLDTYREMGPAVERLGLKG
ncbi:Bug family tripartite tricarboxylate transporter substrate binding protein [Falsiroseomonas sp. HW251]|uniref:Bug family tripartite tricarboxylate transporter substrate binding protein n=1 Tax=Falsiroseomonas sp. HW251 TaxID=3390998 RepID=UPI003D31537F